MDIFFPSDQSTKRPLRSPDTVGVSISLRKLSVYRNNLHSRILPRHNLFPLAVVAEIMMANGTETSILQAIPNLLTVIRRFVKLAGFFLEAAL